MVEDSQERPPCVLVAVQLHGVTDEQHEADLAELTRLVNTLGLDVIGQVSQRRSRLRPGTVLGVGKLEELALWTGGSGHVQPHVGRKSKIHERRERDKQRAEGEHEDDEELEPDVLEPDLDEPEDRASGAQPPVRPFRKATVVVVDHALTPSQQRNLERSTDAEVLDRSQVIVEIFHRHAKSREARLQVEIARLTYVAPRLREAGAGADRQRGGIGGKGAGESSVELDRRRIRDRIAELRRELDQIAAEQTTRRALRSDQRRVALVGYTNAGKSSLMRALTGSEVYVADKLFATLDTTVRALRPEADPRILVSDTVGFIKKLPHELVASFRSTLDEALEASLLLYIVDASDPTFRDQLEVTQKVLGEIGATEVEKRIVLNKRDRLTEEACAALHEEFPDALILSARIPADVARLREAVVTFFDGEPVEEELFVPYAQHGLVSQVHDAVTVTGERHDDLGTHLAVRAPVATLGRIKAKIAAASSEPS